MLAFFFYHVLIFCSKGTLTCNIAIQVVQEGNSVLIFCSSRKGCESTAKHISKLIKKVPVDVDDENSEFMDIRSAIDALRRSPSGVDPVLEETLPSGVAYHHAGLTVGLQIHHRFFLDLARLYTGIVILFLYTWGTVNCTQSEYLHALAHWPTNYFYYR